MIVLYNEQTNNYLCDFIFIHESAFPIKFWKCNIYNWRKHFNEDKNEKKKYSDEIQSVQKERKNTTWESSMNNV